MLENVSANDLPLPIPTLWLVIAGICAWAATALSAYEALQHVLNFTRPYLQRHVVRMLGMVPMYALCSWWAIRFPSLALYLEAIRECYEAFVIYSFMKYLTNFLQRDMDLDSIIDSKPPVKHLFPMCHLPPMPGGRAFLFRCRHGILQYIVVRPLTTFLTLTAEVFGIYYSGFYSLSEMYVYILIINNISQMIALYFLAMFYTAYKRELSPMHPLSKFLCIKAVIFLSFFQSCAIDILIQLKIVVDLAPPGRPLSADSCLQDLLICVEMFAAAVAHLFAFSHKPFVDLAAIRQSACHSLMRLIDFSDERSDITDHVTQIYSRCRVFFRQRHARQHSYRSPDFEVLIPLRPVPTGDSASASNPKYQSNNQFQPTSSTFK